MNKKILILGIIIFCGLLAINSANAQDIEVKNKGITFDEFFDYPDGKSSMEFRVKYSDKYDNDAYIIVDLSNDDKNEIKDAIANKKSINQKYISDSGVINKKIDKIKDYKGTILINKKTLKDLKKAIKYNKDNCVVWDEGKYAHKAYKVLDKAFSSDYNVKIKVKNTVYKYSLYSKCYGDSRDYKYLKFYRVAVYLTGYNHKFNYNVPITCNLNIDNGKTSVVFYAGKKLMNYKMFYTVGDFNRVS